MISSIILAAGESERMSSCKQLLKIAGESMISRVVRAVEASKVDEIIIVIGHRADKVREVLPSGDFDIVFNPNYREGMSTSLRAGVDRLGADSEAVLIVLGDQPLVEPEVIDKLIRTY